MIMLYYYYNMEPYPSYNKECTCFHGAIFPCTRKCIEELSDSDNKLQICCGVLYTMCIPLAFIIDIIILFFLLLFLLFVTFAVVFVTIMFIIISAIFIILFVISTILFVIINIITCCVPIICIYLYYKHINE